MAKQFTYTSKIEDTCILVGLVNQKQTEEKITEYLDELEFLAETAGIKTVKRFTQKLERPDSKVFIGTGKLQEIKSYIKEHNITSVIFDDELSPSQQRNIEKELDILIHDRTTLILNIFASRARTSHAKTQVELAQLEYLLPRLAKMWSHLDRIKGGIGMKGAGEKEIETDRRIVREKIAFLKGKIALIDRQMSTQRKNRGELVRVALVGYTNVGKSTLMNQLAKSEVFAENKLFATLDTTVRKIVLAQLPFLLSDTVGFIRKLPTQLVESFKSTLDEVREADILLHIVDVSNPAFEDHINTVNKTLMEIGAGDKPTLMVFNKIDAFTFDKKDEDDLTEVKRNNYSLDDLKRMWMGNIQHRSIFISAIKKENWEELKRAVYDIVLEIHKTRYPNYLSPSEEELVFI
ncbi:MAG: GTPase HflX [Bacteroidota bacterium]|jgi:GTP-binding protein HflX